MSNWFKDFLNDPFGTVGGTVSNLFDDVDLEDFAEFQEVFTGP